MQSTNYLRNNKNYYISIAVDDFLYLHLYITIMDYSEYRIKLIEISTD